MASKNETVASPTATEAQGSSSHGMSPDDVSFLVDCLMNPTDGAMVSIDCKAVAVARGQKNPGSISNRINKLKKKYNLPIGTSSGSGSGATPRKAQDASEASIPNTTSTSKVVKGTRGRAIPKKSARRRATAVIDSDEGEEVITKSPSGKAVVKAKEADSDDEKAFVSA